MVDPQEALGKSKKQGQKGFTCHGLVPASRPHCHGTKPLLGLSLGLSDKAAFLPRRNWCPLKALSVAKVQQEGEAWLRGSGTCHASFQRTTKGKGLREDCTINSPDSLVDTVRSPHIYFA